jgi:hypothetical protein
VDWPVEHFILKDSCRLVFVWFLSLSYEVFFEFQHIISLLFAKIVSCLCSLILETLFFISVGILMAQVSSTWDVLVSIAQEERV